MFLEKGVLKICSKFTGEHPCQSAKKIKLLCNRHGCSLVNLEEHLWMAAFTSQKIHTSPSHLSVSFHIETSHLICSANRLIEQVDELDLLIFYLYRNDDNTAKEWISNITAISFDMIFARDILENAWQQL